MNTLEILATFGIGVLAFSGAVCALLPFFALSVDHGVLTKSDKAAGCTVGFLIWIAFIACSSLAGVLVCLVWSLITVAPR
jgi:hypothetical protein